MIIYSKIILILSICTKLLNEFKVFRNIGQTIRFLNYNFMNNNIIVSIFSIGVFFSNVYSYKNHGVTSNVTCQLYIKNIIRISEKFYQMILFKK